MSDKQYKTRTLQPHQRNMLARALQAPMYQALQPPVANWAFMTGAEAVAAGLVGKTHVRAWPGRRRWPAGVCWVDVSLPGHPRTWAWGFAPWYLEQMAVVTP